jgi:hypothetical protein
VTERFARVFGNNEDTVHACIDCAPNRELAERHGESDSEAGTSLGRW